MLKGVMPNCLPSLDPVSREGGCDDDAKLPPSPSLFSYHLHHRLVPSQNPVTGWILAASN